ncbi:helix-turn-helix domain-containing protein [Cohnella thermotolerans]|uniref:helix-turn-helix domain-containing protein n=1 Tax=Cohnella thermotolerans TaxID=329858 RepID=UPI0030846D2E
MSRFRRKRESLHFLGEWLRAGSSVSSRSPLDGPFPPNLHPAKGKNRTRLTARLASLLLHSRMHISEVSSETGFTNDAQFCNIFKRETGMSPGAYRKAKADSL